ncbi:MAG TPA: AzlD domain-containing protein [Beijerinckiaceae bacterium]|nr:AzlD domain-containing protein [Rhodoblastus sp.]MCB9999843.1 AzlD domain-containing protein [Methylobacteriaceae bacterium]MCC2110060.1 AzlD domain-containing protein [Hyphomicrobiales bacterium]HRY05192.1 AzlD domain-containing protein [Beijerinckiaceae bacterium]MCB1522512.1 AzlD domain-containing protein [Rhodoblastus sp.]
MTMSIGPWTVIFATAAVTILMRLGGYWLMARVPMTARVRRGLEALPASIFIATVAPIALKAGVAGVAAVCVAAGVMFLLRRELPALAAGFATAAGLRAMGM